jgi:hypothetical protein
MVEVFPTLMAIDEAELILVGTIAGVIFLVIIGTFFIVSRFYRQVDQGKALIVNKKAGPQVVFTGTVVLPIIHRAEIMDISVKSLDIDRRGNEGLICKDNIRADIKVAFFVRVNKTPEDVLKVAQSIGCARASDLQTLDELFSGQILRGAEDGRQAARVRRAVHQARRVQGPAHRGDRPRPQRLHPRPTRRSTTSSRRRSTSSIRITSSTLRAFGRSLRSRPSRTSSPTSCGRRSAWMSARRT